MVWLHTVSTVSAVSFLSTLSTVSTVGTVRSYQPVHTPSRTMQTQKPKAYAILLWVMKALYWIVNYIPHQWLGLAQLQTLAQHRALCPQ